LKDALPERWAVKILLAIICLTLLVEPALMGQTRQGDRVPRLLEELSNAPGPSGFEGPVREIIVRELRALGVETSTDGLGSVIGVLAGSSERPRIMLAAHMDEVGAIVRYVTPEGMVKFQPLGGWLDQALVDQRWTIMTDKGPVPALSGFAEPPLGDTRRAEPCSPTR
jgi:endoglucanase